MDVEGVVRSVNKQTGDALEVIGPCVGGEADAWLVRDDHGIRLVMKWWDEVGGRLERLEAVERRAQRLRKLGYPIPVLDRLVAVDGVVVLLQEESMGRPVDVVTPALLGRLAQLNELQAGQGTGEGGLFGEYLTGTLLVGGPGYCFHHPLRQHSPRAEALLERIRAIGSATEAVPFLSIDAIHLDFHHRNVLVDDDGVLTAIIDWDGCRDGDRWFDLACLSFHLDCFGVGPGAAESLRAHVEANVEPATLAAYRAHMVLRQVDWSIRNHDEEVVQHCLEVGERMLGGWPPL